jgi:hypothetical protein
MLVKPLADGFPAGSLDGHCAVLISSADRLKNVSNNLRIDWLSGLIGALLW